ncbi:DUF4433 domain-containing protein [Desulfothermus naphthae]
MKIPNKIKIYHIIHVENLENIIKEGYILSDYEIQKRNKEITSIGMAKIKKRRLTELKLSTYPDLYVGQCVPFYFCPRSVMLYIIYKGNHPEINSYCNQEEIIHLQADFFKVVNYLNSKKRKWVFTFSNAGSYHFEDTNQLDKLKDLNWDAINAKVWTKVREEKQAEFLCEEKFEWQLIEKIGVKSLKIANKVSNILQHSKHKPPIVIKEDWYY